MISVVGVIPLKLGLDPYLSTPLTLSLSAFSVQKATELIVADPENEIVHPWPFGYEDG